jgi:3-deoxy-D-manno-octulosonate 8-phosphate phosphatase (KDO 8-P phosphatase)
MANYLDKLKEIKCFVFDVDGVLTDGKIIALSNGEQARTFLIKDGYAIERALKAGYHIAIISGGNQEGVFKRLQFLNIEHIYLGVKDKVSVLKGICDQLTIEPNVILYMGDDWPDYEVMQLVGLPACPADAVSDVRAISNYISDIKGGEGCVRDVIEKVMRVQGTWHKYRDEIINN